ncbi:MAG: hypothetical protein MJZ06_07825 [Bacteroidaceae bacterium]|nr:hypothetical protein [Bacteroidaceae bacterium]
MNKRNLKLNLLPTYLLLGSMLISCEEKDGPSSPEKPAPMVEATAFTAIISDSFGELSDYDIAYGSFGVLYSMESDNAQSAFNSWANGNDKPDCMISNKTSVMSGGDVKIQLKDLQAETQYTYCVYFKSEDGENRTISQICTFTTEKFNPVIINSQSNDIEYYTASLVGNVTASPADLALCKAGIEYADTQDALSYSPANEDCTVNGDGEISQILKNLHHNTTYYYRFYIKSLHTSDVLYGEVQSFTTRNVDDMAIDLGLSVNWASCDFLAQSPLEKGETFAWGMLVSHHIGSRDVYTWYHDGVYDYIGSSICGTEYDVVHQTLGGKWRMPSAAEVSELFEKCQVVITAAADGVPPEMKFISPNGNCMLMSPFTYEYDSYSISSSNDKNVWRWTGTLSNENGSKAEVLQTDYSYKPKAIERYREMGIRPVCDR